ncbi:SDR family NAD(P)-dependent oxidoreductase [Corallococcus llansteffanensis]|uniref:SDR family NAD(P)-dependent oxidoreductase n=1 Tax=Corallococcus llansteffanensis TaxID=2316731 RepID=A0A3A8NYP8_9BACT|nr:SDR family NAD(P)-dependent oxidoreductase [Corallococcus llansteffanensis]
MLAAGPAGGTVVFLWEAGERSGSVDPGVLGHKLAVLTAAARGAAHPVSGGARLVVVTSGALAVQGPPTAPEAATAWGLARTLFAEHPSLAGGLIDLEREPVSDRSVLLLVTALLAPERELEVAFRRSRAYVPRLEAVELPPAPALPAYRADASYLILGGMGALGLAFAGHMAARGAGALILLQRTPLSDMEQGPDPRAQRRAVEALEQAGARVAVVPADVSDARSVARALEELRRRGWPPVKGVVHAAGVLHDGTLARLDANAFTRVLAPKVLGAWLVHRALGDTPLDFFVLFSSAASITGSPGQGNDAAANAFLDSLAPALVAAGRPAVSISWGPWADLGMSARTSRPGMALRSGRGLEVEAALGAFERLRSGALGSHVAVLSFDWGRLGAVLPALAGRPVFSRLVPAPASPASGLDPTKLRAAPPAGARRMLEQYLCSSVATLLGLMPGDVEPERTLTGMGFDSLSAIQLRNTVDEELGVTLPVAGFLEQTTIRSLATAVLLALPEETRADGAEPLAEVEL